MFKDRHTVGKKLAKLLTGYKKLNAVLYALPKGGVIVAYEISKQLGIPLELIVTKKIEHPKYAHYVIGAVSETDQSTIKNIEMFTDKQWLEDEIFRDKKEIVKDKKNYLEHHKPVDPKGKIAIIVDDGVESGFSLFSAINEIRKRQPSQIVVVTPIMLSEMVYSVKSVSDNLIVLKTVIENFGCIRKYYRHFEKVSDQEVKSLLAEVWYTTLKI